MEDSSREDVERITSDIYLALVDTMQESAERAADPFYLGRVQNGGKRAFASDECTTAEYIAKHFTRDTAIMEMGCGYGQLCLLLACLGFTVVGLDAAPLRYRGALSLQKFLHRRNPHADRASFVLGSYPRQFAPEHDLFLSTNVVNSYWRDWQDTEESKYQQTLRAEYLSIDLRTWWVLREDQAEQDALRTRICEVGYAAVEKVGPSSWLFRKDRDASKHSNA